MVKMVTFLLFGEVASRYVQRSVRDDSEKSAVRNLIGMVSAGLCVLCLLSVLRHHRYSTGSVSLQKSICAFLMHAFGVERLDVRHLFVEDDVSKNLVSLRKISISSVAMACRRVGSKRVKSVPASKNIYFKKKTRISNRSVAQAEDCCIDLIYFMLLL